MIKIVLFILLTSLILTAGFALKPSKDSPSSSEEGAYSEEASLETTAVLVGKKLDLSGQGLTSIPTYVFDDSKLEELDVSNNSLTGSIQAEVRHLSRLKVLNASNNAMTGVPAEIGQLQKLEVLDLSNNDLTGLPYELGNLKSLKIFNLSGNDYSKQDLDVIKETLPKSVKIIVD